MSLFRKQFQKNTEGSFQASMFFLVLYNLLTVGITIVYAAITQVLPNLFHADRATILLAALLSITVSLSTIICIIGTKFGNVSILVLFAILGQLVLSVVYSLFTMKEGESISGFAIAGLVLALVILALSFKKDETKYDKKSKIIFNILCFVLFFTNGIVLIIYSYITHEKASLGQVNFITLYSGFAALLNLIAFLIVTAVQKKKQMTIPKETKINLLIIFGYASLFTLGEILALRTTTIIPIYIQSPLSFSLQMILLTLFDKIFYKTKLTKVMVAQIILAVVCSVLFAL